MANKKSQKPFEPQVYPPGVKLIEVEFDYKYDVGIPGVLPIDVRFSQNFENIDLATVQLERMKGSITIDTARKSGSMSNINQTTSVKRIPKNTPTVQIGLIGSEPLYYRVHKYTRIVSPSYRTKVKVRLFTAEQTQTKVVAKAMKIFNQFLKAYRVASGDPVSLVNENENKELGVINFRFSVLPDVSLDKRNTNPEAAIKLLHEMDLEFQLGPQMGLSTNDIDMIAKPYIKPHALETVRLAFLPEEIKPHAELILDAIERAHRSQDYGMAIVMLNTAFEAAITTSLITSLIFLDYDKTRIDKYFADHPRLEDKRNVIDDLREKACKKYGVKVPKKFRGSGEEGRWDKSTNQKRHWGVHIVRNKDAHPLKIRDFKVALKDTQDAIKLLEVPVDELKTARLAQNKTD